MCGIVGAVAQRNVQAILIEGLKRLEYRGYDSAGLAVLDEKHCIKRMRALGKVGVLAKSVESEPLLGTTGIAHTRWATHGAPSEKNAHPHICKGKVAVVHNGIIENYEELKEKQIEQGYSFTSETDTEVISHLIEFHLQKTNNLLQAVQDSVKELKGAFALGVMSADNPHQIIAARSGSPLVLGVGVEEHFIASDVPALLPVTQRFIFLEEGDIAEVGLQSYTIYNAQGEQVTREIRESDLCVESVEKGNYRHYMLKEIFEQPSAVSATLESRITNDSVDEEAFGVKAKDIFKKVRHVQIIACGTSYHAGIVARYWLESIAKIHCSVEVASEFRYRDTLVQEGTLFVTISQSGETADTLAALREIVAKKEGYCGTLAICNVAESSLVRESDLVLLTRAGPEIGVASTKAFVTQLTALLLLVTVLGKRNGLSDEAEKNIVQQLRSLPGKIEHALSLDEEIAILSEEFANKHNALFLGRGIQYPIAMEGALKLKEISYIHAEAYPAGELKHGPLALVDAEMPVISVAPNNNLFEKLKSNFEEVRARGGQLIVFADSAVGMKSSAGIRVIEISPVDEIVAPIVFTIPLQLLSYHVAVLKGTDVDQPRNLAKSVTVE